MDQSGVGDALLREKIVASATREEIIIADSSKEVLVPANFLCPVEVIRFAEPVRPDQLRRMLAYMLDENEFLSPYGVRAVSRYHRDHPLILNLDGQEYRLDYEPGESGTNLFGGNSNWRGPI
jgi:hypothetical protein